MDCCHLTRLRTTTALVHATPGATLHIECSRGDSLVVGRGSSADLSPCQFRRVLAAEGAAGGAGVDLTALIDSVAVGGSIEPAGPGIYVDRGTTAGEGRRITSILGPLLVEQVLRALPSPGPSHRGVDARLLPDDVLGVVTVHLVGRPGIPAQVLQDVTVAAAGAVLAEEALMAARSARSPRLGHPGE